jgi:hypothetical protein
MAFLLLHSRVKPIQIREIRGVALDASHILPNLFHRCVEFALPPASDEYMSSFANEELSGSEPDARTASGDDCHFTL